MSLLYSPRINLYYLISRNLGIIWQVQLLSSLGTPLKAHFYLILRTIEDKSETKNSKKT